MNVGKVDQDGKCENQISVTHNNLFQHKVIMSLVAP